MQERLAPGRRDRLQRLRRDGEPVADTAGVDDDVVGTAHHHLAADRGDHAAGLAPAIVAPLRAASTAAW